MHYQSRSTPIQRSFALAIPLVAGAWFVTVPALLTTSSFIGLVGVIATFGWIVKATYLNAQPSSSLAQSLHDAEHTGSHDRGKERR